MTTLRLENDGPDANTRIGPPSVRDARERAIAGKRGGEKGDNPAYAVANARFAAN